MRESYEFGPYQLDVGARRLLCHGTPVALTLRGFDLLVALVRKAGQAVRRGALLEEVWRDVIVEEGNLDTHVSALRKALVELPGAIETVRGFGYRFAAPVTTVGGPLPAIEPAPLEPAPPPAIEVAATAADTLPAPAPPAPRVRPWAIALPAILVSAVVIAALLWLARERGIASPEVAPHRPHPVEPTLAVLPLLNLSGRAQDAWLGTALREVLTSEVSRAERVAMISGDTVTQLAREVGAPSGSTVSSAVLDRYHERLGADLVLAGTYLVVGPSQELRLDLRLYDTRTGRAQPVISDTGTVAGLLPVVGRVGDSLRRELGVPADGGAATSTGTVFPDSREAMEHYSNGLALLRGYHPRPALDELELAVAASPEFALARGALADAMGQLGREREARDEARRALDLAGDLPNEERLRLEARLYELTNQWTRAVAIGRELHARFPENLDYGLALAGALTNANDPAAALVLLANLGRMRAPKGSDPRIDLARGWAARFAGDFPAMRAAGAQATAKGRALGSELVAAQGLALVSWAELSVNHWRQGLVACEEGARLAAHVDDGFLRSRNLGLCGWNHLNLVELDQAEANFREALVEARRDGDLDQATDFLAGLGNVAASRGHVAERQRLHEEGVAVAREAGDIEAEVEAQLGVSEALMQSGKLVEADGIATEALALARSNVTAFRVSNALGALAAVREARGRHEEARGLLAEAIELRRRHTPARAGWLLLDLAGVELAANRPEEALRRLAEARPLLGADDELAAARMAALAAGAQARLGHPQAVEQGLQRLAETSNAMPWNPAVVADLDLARADALDRLGHREEAARLWREIAARPALRELRLVRLEATLRLAQQEAMLRPAPATLAAAEKSRGEVRAAHYGALLDEPL